MRTLLSLAFAGAVAFATAAATTTLQLHPSTNSVGAFGRLEFTVSGVTNYADPFDPAIVDLRVEFAAPGGKQIVVPAFFAQEYERRRNGEKGAPADWAYPVGSGAWKVRFTPPVAGKYSALAVLKDRAGEERSAPVAFDCVASNAKGFVRLARRDPRFLEFDNGEAFFAIGQNLAFIGEQQHVTVPKAEEIFAKLADNGANCLRIWTCAEDWALAIEARKSAWGRSWSGRGRIVADPDNPARQCLRLTSSNATQEVNPSHPVSLRPATRYVVTGRVRTETNAALRLEVQGAISLPLASKKLLAWTEFRHEFTTGTRDWRLGQTRFRVEGNGAAWLSDISLKEAGASSTGPELLWEAELNRPVRGFYNPLDCFLLDELLTAAEQRGIYLQLCMLTRDLYMNAVTNASTASYSRAIADAKKFFRYAIARWGYSTSVAAWEYWNEMNPGLPTDRFYTELGEFFETTDPYHHLRTTSTWGPSAKDCQHSKLDVADVHFYLRPTDQARLANEVDAVLERTRWLRAQAPNKPAHLGEFGLADDKWRITDDMRRSPDLNDMHNALWASALSGASGTAMFWWWERIDQRNGYTNYFPLSRFVATVPWNSGELQPLEAKCSDETMRVIGLRTSKAAWFWIFDPAAAWQKVAIEKQLPPVRRGLRIELQGVGPMGARALWFDTRSGATLTETPVRETDGALRVEIPEFQRDVACRIEAR